MSQLLLRRAEVISRLQKSGLTYRQARRALKAGALPQAIHRLHTQARWWKADVEKFDCLAFLQTVNHDGGGEQGLTQTAAPLRDLNTLPS